MINGIINVYKEAGYTSFDVVAKLRGITKQKKIGHTGTLDPDATGVLPVCFGSATKLCDMLTDKTKEYEATFRLGIETDTLDISGKVTKESYVNREEITDALIREVIASFVGRIEQIPPMYSAIKINGKKLYELAREGKEVERKAREVEILYIDVLAISGNDITVKVGCSKGTYIRTLCDDIGHKLGCGAVMTKLIRTRSGEFTIEEASRFDDIAAAVNNEGEKSLEDLIIPIDRNFMKYGMAVVSGEYLRRVTNGNYVNLNPQKLLNESTESDKESKDYSHIRVYDDKGDFLAIYEYQQDKKYYSPEKMFLN